MTWLMQKFALLSAACVEKWELHANEKYGSLQLSIKKHKNSKW